MKWIKRLPPGMYDISDLKNFSGLTSLSSIKGVMLRNGAEMRYVSLDNSNLRKSIFIWNGFKGKI